MWVRACLGGRENRRSLLMALLAVGGVSGFTVGLFCERSVRQQQALSALRGNVGRVLP